MQPHHLPVGRNADDSGKRRRQTAEPIVSPNLVKELWILLTKVFIYSDIYDNQFDAIFAMDDIYLYSRRQNIKLCLKDLEKWREKHNKNINFPTGYLFIIRGLFS